MTFTCKFQLKFIEEKKCLKIYLKRKLLTQRYFYRCLLVYKRKDGVKRTMLAPRKFAWIGRVSNVSFRKFWSDVHAYFEWRGKLRCLNSRLNRSQFPRKLLAIIYTKHALIRGENFIHIYIYRGHKLPLSVCLR